MTLDETLLQKLADWRPAGEGRHTLTVPVEGAGWTVSVTADWCDELSSRLWEVQALRAGAAVPDGWSVGAWAGRVAERVAGLREPLLVLEVDAVRDEALLRSTEPSARGGKLSYYEVLLKGVGQATMRRYQAEGQGGKREAVGFPLTHEVLVEFITSLTAA
jgi:hypothetical protein